MPAKKIQKTSNTIPKKDLLTVSEASTLLHCHPNTLRRWEKVGLIHAVRLGNNGHRKFRYSEIQKTIKHNGSLNYKKNEQRIQDSYQKKDSNKDSNTELIELLPHLIWTSKTQGKCDFLNKQWEIYTGIERSKLTGYGWLKFIHPEDMTRLMGAWNHAFDTNSGFELDYRIRRFDGAWRWFKSKAEPIYNNKGKVVKWYGSNTDIQEVKKDEIIVKQSEMQLQTVFENLSEGVVVANADGQLLGWNPRALEIHGFKKLSDAQQQLPDFTKIFEIFEMDDTFIPLERWPLSRILKGERLHNWELKVKHIKEGWHRVFNYGGELVKNNYGKPHLAIVTIQDITKQKDIEHVLKQSEELHKTLVDASPDCIKLYNVDGTLLYINKAGLKYHCMSSLDEIKKWNYYSCIMPDDRNKLNEAFQKALGGEENTFELRHINTCSKREICMETMVPVKNEKNEVIYVYGVSRDITHQKKAEQALKNSEKRFRELSDSMPQLVWTAEPNGTVDYYNNKYLEYDGIEKVGNNYNWSLVLHPEDQQRTIDAWNQSIKTGNIYEITHRVKTKNGTYRWLLSRGIPIRDESGKIIKWYGTATDIHENKLLEQQKDDFLAVASHELKTPVTSIKAYEQVLRKSFIQKADGNSVELLDKMDGQINKLTALISDLLDVTKINAGKILFNEELFDFNSLIYEIVEEIQRTTAHTIVTKLTKSQMIYGDRDRTGQVIINLLTNAIKYSPAASKVIVSTKKKENKIVLSVQDFGVGIPEKVQSKLFERFFRVSSEIHSTFPGLGLGLFISKEIVQRQNGKIWVESEQGKGSIFSFSLPIIKNKKKQKKKIAARSGFSNDKAITV